MFYCFPIFLMLCHSCFIFRRFRINRFIYLFKSNPNYILLHPSRPLNCIQTR